jgi:hypothetical protein
MRESLLFANRMRHVATALSKPSVLSVKIVYLGMVYPKGAMTTDTPWTVSGAERRRES